MDAGIGPTLTRRPRLAISLGDPCGIGPELLLRSLPALAEQADLIVVGPRAGLDLLAAPAARSVTWALSPPTASVPLGFHGQAWGLRVLAPGGTEATALWLDPTPEVVAADLRLGTLSAPSGRATVEAIRTAAGLALDGTVDALVTLPMAKAAAHLAGFDIPGHTEFLQALAGASITRMAFFSPTLNVVLHTVHQSLRSVVEGLDARSVAATLAFSAHQFQALTGRTGLAVALCALNPHAGEQGAFGGEEALLDEALRLASAAFPAGPDAPRFSGPHPSDSLFLRAARGEFDLVIALYHDQGLIPVKLFEPDRAVNVTLGLPYVRTSPDHGTAFDKAGQWCADPTNFQAAAALAIHLAGRARPAAWSGLPLG